MKRKRSENKLSKRDYYFLVCIQFFLFYPIRKRVRS